MILNVLDDIATLGPAVRVPPLSQQELAEEVRRVAGRPGEWVSRVRLDPGGRWYERIHACDQYELWLISWLPGQATGFHDHGGASGAFGVVWGALEERVVSRSAARPAARPVTRGVVRAFGPRYIHDVRNISADCVAVSVHAYSPPLATMTRYDLTLGGLAVAATQTRGDW
jgi:predicted metal-dependent enzyme (double-stranded beta helix superfamily)